MSMAMTTRKVSIDDADHHPAGQPSWSRAASQEPHDRKAWRWSLIRLIPAGADVILQGSRPHPDEASCHREVSELIDVCADCMMSVQHPDGSWFWIIYGAAGEPIAHSGRFETAAASARALYLLRHELSSGVDVVLHDERQREHASWIDRSRR